MLSTSSSTLVAMASQLSEAEERERLFSGKGGGRWNQLRSLGDAKNVLNYLYNLASSARCSLRDKEVDCREKDEEIKELKEKVVKINTLVRQLENQKAELAHQVQQLKQSAVNNFGMRNGGHVYDLRQGPRMSGFNFGRSMDLTEDMDILESEHSNSEDDDNVDDDDEWIIDMSKKRNSKNKGRQSSFGSSNATTEKDDSVSLKATEVSSGDFSTASQEVVSGKPTTTTGICCSCSRQSSCKTAKCECRANGGNCSSSCSCLSSKCSNREAASEQESIKSKEIEVNSALASEGAALLQNALADMPSEKQEENENNGPSRRKPLADIGNTAGKSNAPRPNQRKKWRRSSVIQLVPAAAATPPNSTPTMDQEPPQKIEQQTNDTHMAEEVNTQLRLPRAMRSNSSSNSNNTLRDRNTDHHHHQEESSLPGPAKGSGIPAPPHLRPPKAGEKENNGV